MSHLEDGRGKLRWSILFTASALVTVSGAAKRAAYDTLRMTLTDTAGDYLALYRFRGAPAPDPARYEPLMRAWPAAA